MKLSRTDPQTDVGIDMTPMIDVVFQLIIFFMLITDMTQKELEELVLPDAQNADPDKPDPTVVRPILNILADGKILVKRTVLYDPEHDDGYTELKSFLAEQAKRMPKKPANDDGTGPMVPDNPLLIRADQSTPFKYIQQVMYLCALQGIQIWKIQLAAAEQNPDQKPKPKE
jgi:biopolymer transport protein ExbD